MPKIEASNSWLSQYMSQRTADDLMTLYAEIVEYKEKGILPENSVLRYTSKILETEKKIPYPILGLVEEAVLMEMSRRYHNHHLDRFFSIGRPGVGRGQLTDALAKDLLNGLTTEELKEMELKKWVWIEVLVPYENKQQASGYYRKHIDITNGESFCAGYPGLSYAFDYKDYGLTWKAYIHNPNE